MVYTSKVASSVEENVDILGSAPSNIVVPSFSTALESAIFIGSLCEEAYTDLMESIGVEELRIYESTGAEILYEDAEGNETKEGAGLKNKIVGFFQKIWTSIKTMFENAIKWFQEKIHQAKVNKMDKVIKEWHKKRVNVKGEKTFGKARYIMSEQLAKQTTKSMQNFRLDACISNAISKFKNSGELNPVEEIASYYSGMFAGAKEVKDLKPAALKACGIPEEAKPVTVQWIDSHLTQLHDIVIGGKDTTDIKKNYQTIKAEVNKLAKEFKTNADKKSEDLQKKLQVVAKILPAVAAASGAQIDIMKTRYAEANRIIASMGVYLKIGSKNPTPKSEDQVEAEESGAKNESVLVTAIESAFDW